MTPRSKRYGRRRKRSSAFATTSRVRCGSPDQGGNGPLLVEIEQPLDRGVDAREIGERELILDGNPRKRGKTRGGMILRFSGRRESDSLWECRLLQTSIAFRTPI